MHWWLGVAAGSFIGAVTAYCCDDDGKPVPVASWIMVILALASLGAAGWAR